jgi:hypothetical protein
MRHLSHDHVQAARAEAQRCCHAGRGYPCVVPPYLLDATIRRGKEAARDAALRTRNIDDSVRFARALATLERRQLEPRVAARRRRVAQRGYRRAIAAEVRRRIYDAQNQDLLPGVLVRSEGQAPIGDVAADEAYDGLGATFDLFADTFGRNSIDGAGMALVATVHYEEDYDNAIWDGSQMIFGDGDGVYFNRFTLAVDVIAHELTHGVTQSVGGLIYRNQSGALNESVSDVFGSLVKQFIAQEDAAGADWLIGEGLFTNAVDGVALRSMAAPGTAYDDPVLGRDPQPAHMRDFVRTSADYGGVHINSGIPNHAFYLLATALGGYAWERAGLIWYDALTSRALRPRTGFRRFAQLTLRAAVRRFGAHTEEAIAVQNAWAGVGITVGSGARSRERVVGRGGGTVEPWRRQPRADGASPAEDGGNGAPARPSRSASSSRSGARAKAHRRRNSR